MELTKDLISLNAKVQKHNDLIKGKQNSLSAMQNKMILYAAINTVRVLKGEQEAHFEEPLGKGKGKFIKLDSCFIAGVKSSSQISGQQMKNMRIQLGDLASTTISLFQEGTNNRMFGRQFPIAVDTLGEIERDGNLKEVRGDGGLYLQLHDHIIEQFKIAYEEGNFTQYLLKNVYFLSKGHSWALYELCRMELNQKHRAELTMTWNVSVLADRICSNKYRKKDGSLWYSQFKTRVLLPSIDDINVDENCDINIELVKEIKKGRSVNEVVLHFGNYAEQTAVPARSSKQQVVLDGEIELILSRIFDQSKTGLKTIKVYIKKDLAKGISKAQVIDFLTELEVRKDKIKGKAAYYHKMVAQEQLKPDKAQKALAFGTKAPDASAAFQQNNQKRQQVQEERVQEEQYTEVIRSLFRQELDTVFLFYLNEFGDSQLSQFEEYLKVDSPFKRKQLEGKQYGDEVYDRQYARFLAGKGENPYHHDLITCSLDADKILALFRKYNRQDILNRAEGTVVL